MGDLIGTFICDAIPEITHQLRPIANGQNVERFEVNHMNVGDFAFYSSKIKRL